MTSVKDVQPGALINGVSAKLKQMPEFKPPEWAAWVKTGAHKERKPADADWWYVRCASVLRKVSINGPTGVGKLRNWYGGKKSRGVKPEKHVIAGGKIIRLALQQLEKASLIQKNAKGGRVITKQGQSLLDKTSAEIAPRREPKPAVATDKKPVKRARKPKADAPQPEAEAKPEVEKAE